MLKKLVVLEVSYKIETWFEKSYKTLYSGWNESFSYILFAHALATIIIESELIDANVFNRDKPKQIKAMFWGHS